MKTVLSTQVKLHLIILLLGLTGIVGAIVTLDSVIVVWYRMVFAIIGLYLYFLYKRESLKVDKDNLLKIMGTGVLVSLHWIFFFESIKVSNVSVALACFASTSLFASILEPIFYKRKIIAYEIAFGICVIIGLYLIFKFESAYAKGIFFALLSALLDVLFVIFNGKLIKKNNAKIITFYELIGGIIFTSIYLIFTQKINASFFTMSFLDFNCLLFLGIICTSFAFVVTTDIMREVSPYTIAISFNLDPIYSILFALLFFGKNEFMSLGFYIGTVVILSTVFANSYFKAKKKPNVAT